MEITIKSSVKIKQLTIVFEGDEDEEVKVITETEPSFDNGVISKVKKSEPVKKDLTSSSPCLEVPLPTSTSESFIDPEFASSQF